MSIRAETAGVRDSAGAVVVWPTSIYTDSLLVRADWVVCQWRRETKLHLFQPGIFGFPLSTCTTPFELLVHYYRGDFAALSSGVGKRGRRVRPQG
jgi:hypothetical protein